MSIWAEDNDPETPREREARLTSLGETLGAVGIAVGLLLALVLAVVTWPQEFRRTPHAPPAPLVVRIR